LRHHYVPQFLLRVWAEATPDGKVEVFRLDLPALRSPRRSPKHTGYEDDLYALSRPVVAGMEQQAVEKHILRDVDDLAARVRRKLAEHGLRSLSPTERMDWVRFLVSLRLRQPSVVQKLRIDSAEHLRRTLAVQPEQYEAIAQFDDAPTLDEWTEQRYPGLIENFGLSIFANIIGDYDVGNLMLRMKWWLWDFSNAKHDLLLADHPCIFTSGLDDEALVIALPISPTKAFMATRSDASAEALRRQRPQHLAMRLNESSLAQARTRVYGRDASASRFIRNRLALRAY
jgi:hypothetical protein